MMHSIKYSCAMASLQLTTCSKMPGNTSMFCMSTWIISNWLNLTRFVPTKILGSILSLPHFPLPAMVLVLHPHPQLIHLRKVKLEKVDTVIYLAIILSLCKLSWLQLVGEYIPSALEKVVPQEESS